MQVVEILLPATDGGVAVQALVAVVVFTAGLVLVRRDRELRLLVVGLGAMTAAWFALRLLH